MPTHYRGIVAVSMHSKSCTKSVDQIGFTEVRPRPRSARTRISSAMNSQRKVEDGNKKARRELVV
jgi:hypothetical protein